MVWNMEMLRMSRVLDSVWEIWEVNQDIVYLEGSEDPKAGNDLPEEEV